MTDKQETNHAFARSLSNAGLGMIAPNSIAAFDRSDVKRHLYNMTDGSQKRLTRIEAAQMLIAVGSAPFILGAPEAYMPNIKLSAGERREEEL